MALPEKQHFSLAETATRWEAQLHDLYYYAEHGLLEVQTWLDMPAVRQPRLKKTVDGEVVPVVIGLTDYKGYAVVEPEDLRRIFRNDGKSAIEKFRPLAQADLIEIFDDRAHLLVSPSDLVVSRRERDRFENTYEINCCCERAARAAKCDPDKPTYFTGRPSVMNRVVKHFEERVAQNLLFDSLQKEGEYLHAWAQKNITDSQIPGARTIMNAIRVPYRNR